MGIIERDDLRDIFMGATDIRGGAFVTCCSMTDTLDAPDFEFIAD
jgi:hypothetical protein